MGTMGLKKWVWFGLGLFAASGVVYAYHPDPLAIIYGGTGQVTRQAAIDSLSACTTSTNYLRGNGTHAACSAIQAGDVPTLNQNTTGSAASFTGSLVGDVTGTQGATALTATSNSTLTTLSGLTTASSLATVGTIGTGTWHGTSISPTYGGSGLSNPTAHSVMISEGSSNFALIGPTTAGLVLTAGGASSDPSYVAPNTQTYFLGTQVGAGGGWSTTSTSYANPSVATTSNTLTQIQSNNLTVAAESTKLPAITVTSMPAGCYFMSATFTCSNGTVGITCSGRLMDKTNTVVINGGSGGGQAASASGVPISLPGIECLASTGTTTFALQILTSNGSDASSVLQSSTYPITWMIHGL